MDWEAKNKAIREELNPVKEKLKNLRDEGLGDTNYSLRALDVKMDSLLLQYVGVNKDIGFLKEAIGEIKESEKVYKLEIVQKLESIWGRLDSHSMYIYLALGAIGIISFIIANLQFFKK